MHTYYSTKGATGRVELRYLTEMERRRFSFATEDPEGDLVPCWVVSGAADNEIYLVDLIEALALLPNRTRQGAMNAQLRAMRELDEHRYRASMEPGMCESCGTESHERLLADAAASRSEELTSAMLAYPVKLKITRR